MQRWDINTGRYKTSSNFNPQPFKLGIIEIHTHTKNHGHPLIDQPKLNLFTSVRPYHPMPTSEPDFFHQKQDAFADNLDGSFDFALIRHSSHQPPVIQSQLWVTEFKNNNHNQENSASHTHSLAYTPIDGALRYVTSVYRGLGSFVWDAATLIGAYHPENEFLLEGIDRNKLPGVTLAAQNMNARITGTVYGIGNVIMMVADANAIDSLENSKVIAFLCKDEKSVNKYHDAIQYRTNDIVSRSGVEPFLKLSPYEQLATTFEFITSMAAPFVIMKGYQALFPIMRVNPPIKQISLPGINAEVMLKNISVSATESGLHGIHIAHGTIETMAKCVKSGPKNLGRGFGGQGLYVALEGEESLAGFYADMAAQGSNARPIVLSGELQLNKKTRIAQIEIQKRGIGYQPDFEHGLFPADWATNKELQQVMLDNFDLIEVKNASQAGYATTSDRFLTIHESAGSDIIKWEHPNPSNKASSSTGKHLLNMYKFFHMTYDKSIKNDMTEEERKYENKR